jgi:hypothetical protein
MATIKKQVKALPAPKKKSMDISAEPKKKKKSEIVRYEEDDDGELKLSKNKTKLLLKTQFGKDANKILNLIEREETDPAIALLYKRLLSSVVDILPMAEMGIRKSKGTRGTYQYVQLISTLRELMVDVQSAQDRGMMGESLVMQVVTPAFGDIAQDMVREYSVMAADAKAIMSEDEYEKFRALLLESRGRLADRVTKHYHVIKDGTIGFLQR